MDNNNLTQLIPTQTWDRIRSFLRWCLFQVLAFRSIPRHMAFIMDGNRRYGKKFGLTEGDAHNHGYVKLLSVVRLCYEMGVRYVTVYAFSIDNFKRKPTEVKHLMDLTRSRLEALFHDASIMNRLGIRVEFIGNLGLLDEQIRVAARRLTEATTGNTNLVLRVCIAYTSTDEIINSIQQSCGKARAKVREREDGGCSVSRADLEEEMYLAGNPEPEVLIRTSGETRLSNFMLWQTGPSLLYTPRCLWPEISLMHLVWSVLEYQRKHKYLEKIRHWQV